MTGVSLTELDRARRDPVVFADALIGQPLWPHQVEVVRSPARYRVLCAGRRSGKTRVYGVLALHRAYAVPRSKVLIVSASETSAKRMFADIAGMAQGSRHLRPSLADDTSRLMTLSNGSTIECVPASMKAVRSAEADLLIVDEAGFVDQEIWEAAEPVVGARPGARVLISSTPWRGPGHFFHDLYRRGLESPDQELMSWCWPSTVSPMVDVGWLEGVRSRSAPDYFAREYLAEWTDTTGSYFTDAEIMSAVAAYELTDPAELDGTWVDRERHPAAGGVDWGFAVDANAVVLLGLLDDQGLNKDRAGRLFVPWLEARHRWPWTEFIDRLVYIAGRYGVRVIASETNGVGAYPTDDLQGRLLDVARLSTAVVPIYTDARRKQSGFGKVKALMQSGRLVLPNHPELLKQLRALEFEQLASGSMRIAVPERSGHDDLAMALMQAVSCVEPRLLSFVAAPDRPYGGEFVETTSGFRMPPAPRPVHEVSSFLTYPEGRERGEGW